MANTLRLLDLADDVLDLIEDGRSSKGHGTSLLGVRDAALDAGIAAARAFGASLQAITVIPADVYGAPALMAGPSYIVVARDVEEDIRKDMEATIAGVPEDVPVEGVVLKGRPWRELADKSAELDLLFVGSRGYGPLHAVLLGATSGPLMREAHCPVIALPRGATTDLTGLFRTREAARA